MISGKDTNTVYFSKFLKTELVYKNSFEELSDILTKHSISYQLLEATKDIWCRDFMAIQKNEHEFIQFRYEPIYLKKVLQYQTNPKQIYLKNKNILNFKPTFSTINVDGGNVLQCDDRVIVTDRIFTENPEYKDKNKLVWELEKLFEAEVIVIPQVKDDLTGHADGLVRFVDRNTLIGNDRAIENDYWRDGMNKVLKKYKLDYIDCPFLDHIIKNNKDHAIGCYMNFLEVKNLIVLPIFEVKNNKDEEVLAIFKDVFKDRQIETLNYNNVGLGGGLLNCSTWTVKEQ